MGHKKLTSNASVDSYPDFLKRAVHRKNTKSAAMHPTVIDMSAPNAKKSLEELVNETRGLEISDNYDELYAELLLSENAHLYSANHEVQVESIKKLLKEHYKSNKPWQLGVWVHFPWNNQLVHILDQKEFEALRTIRNRDLINKTEQKKLFDYSIASFGMSVGSAGALAMGLTGVSRKIKLVDGAVTSGSNLNRIMTGVASVGQNKAVTIGRQIYEMNPYAQVEYFDMADSINVEDIFDGPWPSNLVIDEMDDLEMKVRVRVEARRRHLPVLMATELGDTVMLDVERFDQEPKRSLFHNLVPGIEELLTKEIENKREWTKHAIRMIDPKNMTVHMQKSLLKIGSTIVTHPQLGSTVMMTGGVLAFAAKSIALDKPLKSGRYVISLEKQLLSDHRTRKYKRHHKRHTKIIRSAISSM